MIAFNNKNYGDYNFSPDELETQDPIDVLMEEISTILENDTPVIGDESNFLNLDNYVFETAISENKLQQLILDQIHAKSMLVQDYILNVQVYFFEQNNVDNCIIEIYVSDKSGLVSRKTSLVLR